MQGFRRRALKECLGDPVFFANMLLQLLHQRQSGKPRPFAGWYGPLQEELAIGKGPSDRRLCYSAVFRFRKWDRVDDAKRRESESEQACGEEDNDLYHGTPLVGR